MKTGNESSVSTSGLTSNLPLPLNPSARCARERTRHSLGRHGGRAALLSFAAFLSAFSFANAATYYVDYVGGLDTNAGTSGAPFKHCAGDAAASGNALTAFNALTGGDTIILKGGVEYPGQLVLNRSGASGNPITLDGNTAGTFGTGSAILTGADHIAAATWVRCTSTADADGATDWSNCFKALKASAWAADPFQVNLFYDSNRAVLARSPNALDPLYWDNCNGDYAALTTAQITSTTITFPAGFTPAPATGQTWPHAWVGNRNVSNLISLRTVSSTSGDGTILTLSSSSTPRTSLNSFVLFNDGKLLDQRGEYILIDDPTNGPRTKLVFYAGPGGAAPLDALASSRFLGLDLNEQDHYIIQGITFTNYAAGADTSDRKGVGIGNFNKSSDFSTDVLIQNCTVTYCQNLNKSGAINIGKADHITVDSCSVGENQGDRGITMSASDSAMTNNYVYRNTSTAIFTATASRVVISGNDIINNNGLHGNGISAYDQSDQVTISRNYVVDSNFALTLQSATNIGVYYNVLKHPPTAGSLGSFNIYGPTSNDSANITIRNNTIMGEPTKSFKVSAQVNNGGLVLGLIFENNIVDGNVTPVASITTMNNNLHLSKYTGSGGPYIGPTDHYVLGEARPFVNEAGNDFHLISTAWAVNNGIAWTDSGGDLEGNPIVGVRDVGAYEYQSKGTVLGAGKSHTVALKANGTVWTWGSNANGQLGDGTLTQHTTPAQLSTITGVSSVAAGYSHTLALKSDGTVWAWGMNDHGQLGNGTITDSSSPVQVSSLTGVVAISSGEYHNFAIKSDGTLWGWGRNGNSQIGVGSGADKTTPVQITAITGVTKIAGGNAFSVALKSDGTVWAWGSNSSGQLGNGTTTTSGVPVQAIGLSGIASVGAGSSHSLAVSTSGVLSAWGLNSTGQLGDGTTTNHSTPTTITGVSGVSKAVGGNAYSKILTTGGAVWGWGSNAQGQLGNGTTTNSSTPVNMTALSGILDIGSGQFHGVHRRTDGTLADVGYNLNGQLGDGTTTQRTLPVTAIGVDLD